MKYRILRINHNDLCIKKIIKKKILDNERCHNRYPASIHVAFPLHTLVFIFEYVLFDVDAFSFCFFLY